MKLQKHLFESYFYHRNTLTELAIQYNHSREWIQNQIHAYEPTKYAVAPGSVTLVIDATFFGKREEKFGLLVAKDVLTLKPVAYRFIRTETLFEYAALKQLLHKGGYVIQSITIDGKRGLYGLFADVPIQMCHFHQKAIITRYITRKPKLQASIDLKRIVSYLGKTSACRFRYLLESWHSRHEGFLNEKVEDDSKRGWHYKHKRLRSAYRSLRSNLPYLFTYQKYPEFHVPNTTNHLDGGCFSPMKDLLKIHRGIGIDMKRKLITDFLENRRK